MLSIGSFFTAKISYYVSQRKRNAWFCLLSFLAAAGLWRLIQETALILGIDWKDTGSATNSHVTLGKSLPPHWVALFINHGIFVTRPKEFWGSSTGSCFPSPGGCLVYLENGNWYGRESVGLEYHCHGFQFLNLPSVSIRCVALYTGLQSRGYQEFSECYRKWMKALPWVLSSKTAVSNTVLGLGCFISYTWAEYCLMFIKASVLVVAAKSEYCLRLGAS